MGGRPLNQPIVGMAATPDGGGYWEVAADGGIFAFGDAAFDGSDAGTAVGPGTVGIVAARTGAGYLVAGASGTVRSFGDAPEMGDLTTALGAYGGRIVAAAGVPG
jgi:hypothetical protein